MSLSTSPQITWLCDGCKKPVANGTGHMEVRYADISAYKKARAAWHDANPGRMIHGGALLDFPDRARWHVWHKKCDPDPEEEFPVYWFDIERIRTHAQVLKWTAHLMGKRWFEDTNWDQVIWTALRGFGVDA